MDSAAVFLLSLFFSDPNWSREHANEIRKTLRPFPASAANKACHSVKRIVELCPERSNKEEESSSLKKSASTTLDGGPRKTKEFGHNIVFKFPQNFLHKDTILLDRKHDAEVTNSETAYDSLSDDETSTFSTKVLSVMASQASDTRESFTAAAAAKKKNHSSTESQIGRVSPHSREWLVKQLQACRGGLAWKDLYESVFELLSSAQDDTAIQNDVSIIQCMISYIYMYMYT